MDSTKLDLHTGKRRETLLVNKKLFNSESIFAVFYDQSLKLCPLFGHCQNQVTVSIWMNVNRLTEAGYTAYIISNLKIKQFMFNF